MHVKLNKKNLEGNDFGIEWVFKSSCCLYSIGIIVSWIAVVLTFYFSQGYQAILAGTFTRPDPLTCDPGNCWDGAIKHGFPKCTWGTGQGVLGKTIDPGGRTCYKSIYFNLESNAALAYLVYFTFGAFMARAVEYLLGLLVNNSFRWSVLIPIACNFFAVYYS
jgi:hypothetical protein